MSGAMLERRGDLQAMKRDGHAPMAALNEVATAVHLVFRQRRRATQKGIVFAIVRNISVFEKRKQHYPASNVAR